MKRLAIIFGIMCFGIFLMMSEKDKKKIKRTLKENPIAI